MSKDLAKEHDCLRLLIDGEDRWDDFEELFGHQISRCFYRYGVPLDFRRDLFHELVLKLLANDWRIVRKHLRHSGDHSFNTPLRQIVPHLIIDKFIGRSKLYRLVVSLEEYGDRGWDPPAQDVSPEETFFREQGLRQLLMDLSARSRDPETTLHMLSLRFVHGRSVSEIAGVLGMNENTITQRIRYTLKLKRFGSKQPLQQLHGEGDK